MTMDRLRAKAAEGLDETHHRFEFCFGRSEARAHSLVYLRGLMLADVKKNAEAIALRFAQGRDDQPPGQNEVITLQNFLTNSTWDPADVQREIQAVFAEEFAPTAKEWSLGVVGVLDGTSFVKRGRESVGVKRQWCGRLGKTENCQVGEFLTAVTPHACVALDQQLYLPREWIDDKQRRRQTRVPPETKYLAQNEIAVELLRRVRANGHVRFDWVTADAHYGDDGKLLDALETDQQRYLLEIRAEKTFWTVDPSQEIPPHRGQGRHPTRPDRKHVEAASTIAEKITEASWEALSLRDGEKGPVAYEFARVRVWSVRHRNPGPAAWLLVRRSLNSQRPEYKYYVSNADEQVSLGTMALVSGARWRIEEYFKEAKGTLGMADYESRSWTSWHHHMSLVALAHLYVTQTKLAVQEDFPELTLPRAIDLLKAALSRPTLGPEEAKRLTDYHLSRNTKARASHRKSWKKKHKRRKLKPLL